MIDPVSNVSRWFNLDESTVGDFLANKIERFTPVQKFFIRRSLSNNGNVSKKPFEFMTDDMKYSLLDTYIDKHGFIGGNWISYSDMQSVLDKGQKSNRSILHSTGKYWGAASLFPCHNEPDFDQILDCILSSYWIEKITSTLSAADRLIIVRNTFGIQPGSLKWQLFQNLKPFIETNTDIGKYFVRLHSHKWRDYKNLAIKPPPPCLPPFGFDLMALDWFSYSDFTEPIGLWSVQ